MMYTCVHTLPRHDSLPISGVAQRGAVVSGHVAYQPGHVAGQRMLRTDLVAQIELLAYRIEYEARLPAEQAHAEAIERVDVLVYIQGTQMRARRSLEDRKSKRLISSPSCAPRLSSSACK